MKRLALKLALIFSLLSSPAFATLTQDGFASASATSVAMTTTNSNDIIDAFITCNSASGGCTVSGVSGCSLSWVKRTDINGGSANLTSMAEWYGIAASPLSACTVTATFTGSPGAIRLAIIGVNGANTTTPFDVNAGVPKSSSGTTATTLTQTISTSNPNTFLVAAVRSTATLGTVTRPSGFSTLGSAGTAEDLSFKVVSSTQSSLAVTYSWTGATTSSAMIADAIQPPSAGATSSLLLGSDF